MSNAADDFVKSYIDGVHRRCEREASKERTQEEDNQAQAKNDVGSPVSDNTSNPTTGTSSMATNTNTVSPNTSKQETVASMSTNIGAGTGTKTDESSSTGQEKNKTSTATFDAGTKFDASSSLGQEHNKTSTKTSSTGTKTDASSSTGQEKNKTSSESYGSGTKTDALSSLDQEKNKTSTETSSAGTKTDASSSIGQEKNKTSTATFGAGTKIDASSSLGQEHNKTSTETSGSGTKTDASSSLDQEKNKTSTETSSSGTEIDTLSFPDQEQDKTSTETSGAGTKIDASSSRSQEKNKTSTTTSGTGTKIDTSSIPGQELNKTSTERSSAGTKSDASSSLRQEKNKTIAGNDNASSSRTSEEPPEIAVPAPDNSKFESFTLIDTITQGSGIIRSMAVDINDVFFTGSERMIRKWHKGQQVLYVQSSKGTCYAMDAKYMQYPEPCVFVAQDMGNITVWASSQIDGLLTPRWTLHRRIWDYYFPWSEPSKYPISCLCLSDDFNFIYAGSADCTLNTWHARKYDSSPINTIHGHTSAINALAVGLSVVFSGSSDGIIKMWRRETYGRNEDKVRHLLTATFYAQNGATVNAIVFCTVDKVHGCLYAGSSDGNVRCWKNLSVDEPEAGNRELEVMSAHKGPVTCLAWCSGPFVFSGSRDKTIRVWRRETENEAVKHTIATVLRGHTDGITCIAAQNDWEVDNAAGPRQWILYSASLDFTLRIWRVYEQPRAITGGQEVA